VVTTNVLGPIRLIAAFIRTCRRSRSHDRHVSSGLAFAPLAATPSYNASKAAIHMLSESIRLQLAGTSVQIVELEPPAVRTALLPARRTTTARCRSMSSWRRPSRCSNHSPRRRRSRSSA